MLLDALSRSSGSLGRQLLDLARVDLVRQRVGLASHLTAVLDRLLVGLPNRLAQSGLLRVDQLRLVGRRINTERLQLGAGQPLPARRKTCGHRVRVRRRRLRAGLSSRGARLRTLHLQSQDYVNV